MQETYKYPNVFDGKVRTYRPQRTRTRARVGDEKLIRSFFRAVGREMEGSEATLEPPEPVEIIGRESLCLPNYGSNQIAHNGDEGFHDALRHYFPAAESNATEQLVNLKSRLRTATTHDFWAILMAEMSSITGAQSAFVSKRMLIDDQHSAIELPPLGEPGSCLMGVAFYVNNGKKEEMYRDYRYHAYGTPCAYMKHDKVFIIPQGYKQICPNNPNEASIPFSSEAYIGVPLFSQGKSFAHFGLMWSTEGASARKLSWNYIETFMHALEDMISQRLLEGRGFAKEMAAHDSAPAKLIPLSAITASQSLKPYARSLSHELRTPMQGVIGMLDIMYSTILDSIASQENPTLRNVFTELKSHIEVVQDSSKRAVEAADNVVHAYDLNMQMPETPLSSEDDAESDADSNMSDSYGLHTKILKRKHSISSDQSLSPGTSIGFHPGPPLKKMFTVTEVDCRTKIFRQPPTPTSAGVPGISASTSSTTAESYFSTPSSPTLPVLSMSSPDTASTCTRVVIRDFMRSLIHDTLKSIHPIQKVHYGTELGERIEVQTQGPRGEIHKRTIFLSIEHDVPVIITAEEKHLQFSVQKLIDNALKFTEIGSITVLVTLGRNSLLELWVIDTGCGITEEFRSRIFTPHFQVDASIRRSRDGLGLSLFNAKAHVRRNLGGDLTLEYSATEGKQKGSAFLIRLPRSEEVAIAESTAKFGYEKEEDNTSGAVSPLTKTVSMSAPIPTVTSGHSFQATTQQGLSGPSRRKYLFNHNLAKDYPLKFLIAEDNVINRNVAVGSLTKLGYSRDSITLAFDGAEAVRHYEASLLKPESERFTAILMDIWMPNMDGYEATAAITELAQRHGETTTIFAVTADITSECIERARRAGMQRFLAKPYKVFDIERLIIEHFSAGVA